MPSVKQAIGALLVLSHPAHAFQRPTPLLLKRSTEFLIQNDLTSLVPNNLVKSPPHQQPQRHHSSPLPLSSSSTTDVPSDSQYGDVDLLKEVDAIFDSIDTDKDGAISSDELRRHLTDTMGYSTESAGYLFAVLDADINGNVSRDEMTTAFSKYETVALYVTLGLGGSEVTDGVFGGEALKSLCRRYERLEDVEARKRLVLDDLADLIFGVIDGDGSGEIDARELRDHFEEVAKGGCEDPGEAVRSILESLDLNSDGVISREEMREGFKKYDHKALSKALGLRVYRTSEV